MTQRTKNLRLAVLFAASCALSMTLFAPQPASAVLRTVSRWGGCGTDAVGFNCLGVQDPDFPISGLDTVFFDFVHSGAMTVVLTVSRQAFTGTVVADTRTINYPAGLVTHDEPVTTTNVKSGASTSDYLFARIRNSSATPGTTGIAPFGVTYSN